MATSKQRGKRASAALAILFLAFSPESGQPFLFPSGRTGSATSGGTTLKTALTEGRRGGAARGKATSPGRSGVIASVGAGGSGWEARPLRGASAEEGSVNGRRRRLRWEQATSRSMESVKSRGAGGGGKSASQMAATAVPGVHEGSIQEGSHAGHAVEEEEVPTAGELLVKARHLFNDKFGHPEDMEHVCAGYAPGRVNLIGEHTDYNGGFVMPLALQRGTVVYGVGRLVDCKGAGSEQAGACRVLSDNMQTEKGGECADVWFQADESLSPGEPEWANYVKGVVKEFMAKVPEGKRLEFTVTVVGAVPLGGGVSSSASLSVAMGTFLEGVLSTAGVAPPSPKEKAHFCRMAEHKFLNMPCGIMDQFVTTMAVPGHAMLLDCRSEEPAAIPLSDANLVVVVTNSNVKHNLAGSQYPVRVAQCEKARDEVQKRHPGVNLLRDATPEQVEEIEGQVEDAVFRRARHVVSENSRTVAAAQALMRGDYRTAGHLMVDSHRSLREDYEVSCPELDVLVELAMEVEGVYGSRMTGGGFGGCTVTLVEKGSVDSLVRHLREGYSRAMARECSSFVTKPGFGARGLTGAAAATGTVWTDSA